MSEELLERLINRQNVLEGGGLMPRIEEGRRIQTVRELRVLKNEAISDGAEVTLGWMYDHIDTENVKFVVGVYKSENVASNAGQNIRDVSVNNMVLYQSPITVDRPPATIFIRALKPTPVVITVATRLPSGEESLRDLQSSVSLLVEPRTTQETSIPSINQLVFTYDFIDSAPFFYNTLTGSSGGVFMSGTANHPGIFRMKASGGAGATARYYLGYGGARFIRAEKIRKFQFVIQTVTTSDTQFYLGAIENFTPGAGLGNNAIAFWYDPGISTNFICLVKSGGVHNQVITSKPVSAPQYYVLEMNNYGGLYRFTINGEEAANINAAIFAELNFGMILNTITGTINAELDIDYVHLESQTIESRTS
ncbi:MAG: hypothetical protein V2G41_09660 [bacterium JZ-2024 1]